MNERRYSEEEVAAIFERATEVRQTTRRQLAAGEGVTLSDLQEIGREIGISSDLVADAALSLDLASPQTTRKFLGFPMGVSRTIEFDHKLSDEEWDHLVVDLRETFDARGRVSAQGSLKQWTNGNLQALLEPTPSGHRIRLRTTNGNARALMTVGTSVMAFTSVMMIAASISGGIEGAISAGGSVWAVGLGLFGLGAIRLPSWAQARRKQMDAVAQRLEAEGRDPGDGDSD
jgi:hypothetical protein